MVIVMRGINFIKDGKTMVNRKVIVKNEAGIHCRPSSRIMQKVLEHQDCNFKIETAKGETDLTSILSLMSLGLEQGDEVNVFVSGENEQVVCDELADLFSFSFDFPPRK